MFLDASSTASCQDDRTQPSCERELLARIQRGSLPVGRIVAGDTGRQVLGVLSPCERQVVVDYLGEIETYWFEGQERLPNGLVVSWCNNDDGR